MGIDVAVLKDTSTHSSRRVVRATLLIIVGIGVRSITNILLIHLGFQYLGEQQFGLWVLLQSLVMYLNLSDLGVGQGIMNAQAAMAEKRDRNGAIRVLSSGVLIFTIVAIAVWSLTNAAVVLSPRLWHSDVLSHSEFQSYFILLSGLSLAALPLSAFSASLGGLRDLSVRYTWDISLVIAMAVTTSIMFITHQSMLAVLATPLAVQLAWYFIPVALVAIRHSGVTFHPSSVAKETIRALVKSSSFIFLMSLALLTQRYSANFITGTMISVEAVAQVHPHVVLYQIFGWALVDAATRAMLPYITGIGVRGDHAQLQFITVIAAKASTVAAVCFSLAIFIFGPSLMQIWLKKDVFLGLPIVSVLSLIFILDSPAAVFTNISIATESHRYRAVANICYAATSCLGGALGVLFAPVDQKVLGMFIGFLCASGLFHFVVYPRVMRRDLHIPFKTWLLEILLRPLLLFVFCIAVVSGVKLMIDSTGVALILNCLLVAAAAVGFAAFLIFSEDEKRWLGQRLGISIWRK